MKIFKVKFLPNGTTVEVEGGTTLTEADEKALCFSRLVRQVNTV